MHAEFKCQLHGYSHIIQTARDMLAAEIFCLSKTCSTSGGENTEQGTVLGGDSGFPVTSDLNS